LDPEFSVQHSCDLPLAGNSFIMAVLAGLLQSLAGLQEDPTSTDHLQTVATQVQQLFQVRSFAAE
jgi:hypothetical protein